MIELSEEDVRQLVDHDQAFESIRLMFASLARGQGRNFPVVREALGDIGEVFGIKSGVDRVARVLGLKAGGYWPENAKLNLTNHQSTIILFSIDNGKPVAAISANWLTAMRTAAASAISIDQLARPDSEVLGIVGAGFQAVFQLEAAIRRRRYKKVVAWNRTPSKLSQLKAVATAHGIPFEVVSPKDLCRAADVVITITSSQEEHLKWEWIRSGTHVACMGTDTRGKRELDPEILLRGKLFTDDVEQSISIGEAQHAFATGRLHRDAIGLIGDVVVGLNTGRYSDDDITIFDGTGIALQDLALANLVMHSGSRQPKRETQGGLT